MKAVLWLASLVTAFAFAAGPASASTIVVDAPNPNVECPNADYSSIQAAVAAAAPGDVIDVCPGLYPESVVVDKPSLTLEGPATGSAETSCFPIKPGGVPDPTQEAVVAGLASGFRLRANDIVLDGFRLNATGVGVETSSAFSGYVIGDNLADSNALAVSLGSSGATPSFIERNCFIGNSEAVFNVIAQDVPFLTLTPVQNVLIDDNSFRSNTFGIVLETCCLGTANAPVSDITISKNRSLADFAFTLLLGSSSSAVTHNDVTGALFSYGIFLWGANQGLEISDNRIRDVDTGIYAIGQGGGPSSNLLVTRNQIRNATHDGIHAAGYSVIDSVLSGNGIFGSGRDAIRVDLENSGNLFAHNQLLGSGEHDCHDDTVGTGTAGTANTWVDNTAKTENRPGLCVKRAG